MSGCTGMGLKENLPPGQRRKKGKAPCCSPQEKRFVCVLSACWRFFEKVGSVLVLIRSVTLTSTSALLRRLPFGVRNHPGLALGYRASGLLMLKVARSP
jgi:hypothetical protein